MALLVTLFLVLVNIFNSVTGNAPKAEGLTAVETWVSLLSFSSVPPYSVSNENRPRSQKEESLLGEKPLFLFSAENRGAVEKILSCILFITRREDAFNQFKGCVLHYSCIRSACRVRPHPQNDSGSIHNHIFHFMEAEF